MQAHLMVVNESERYVLSSSLFIYPIRFFYRFRKPKKWNVGRKVSIRHKSRPLKVIVVYKGNAVVLYLPHYGNCLVFLCETGLKSMCDTVNSDESFVQKCRATFAKAAKGVRVEQPRSSDDEEAERSDEESSLQVMTARLRAQLNAATMANDAKQSEIDGLLEKITRLEEHVKSMKLAMGRWRNS